jgi:hypothetical protein
MSDKSNAVIVRSPDTTMVSGDVVLAGGQTVPRAIADEAERKGYAKARAAYHATLCASVAVQDLQEHLARVDISPRDRSIAARALRAFERKLGEAK